MNEVKKEETKKDDIKKEKSFNDQVTELVEDKIKKLMESGIQVSNIDYFSKLVDVHKDMENESYWKEKKEVMKMRYNNYSEGGYSGRGGGNYGRRGVPGTGRGRYREGGGGYSAGGGYSGGRDKPAEAMEEAMEHYGAYSEGKEEMNMGNYGAEQDTIKSLDYMLSLIHI